MHHSAIVMLPPARDGSETGIAERRLREYRTLHYLDKAGPARELVPLMAVAVPIESSKPVDPASGRVGVLLVNLGTPDTADARGVRVYLKEFLSDPRVIENQGLLWKLILNGIILRTRPRTKARDYRKIWNNERDESPLKTITRSQAEKLARGVADHDH